MSFRFMPEAREAVRLTFEGSALEGPAGASLLAILLAADGVQRPDWLCAIGQCQRCLVVVDGRPDLACRYRVRGGEDIKRAANTRRPRAG